MVELNTIYNEDYLKSDNLKTTNLKADKLITNKPFKCAKEFTKDSLSQTIEIKNEKLNYCKRNINEKRTI